MFMGHGICSVDAKIFGFDMLCASVTFPTKEMRAAAATAMHKISVTHMEGRRGN